MSGDIRTIDPSLNLGLHELSKPGEGRGSFSFQLKYAKQQIEDILSNLGNLVENTRSMAPLRKNNFCLDRVTAPELTHDEDKWERAMYQKWGPAGSGEYVRVCPRIQAYQYPLQDSRKDRCWGKVDLLGIGADFLPVPNELKSRKNESPLRMLVEVAAYGFAVRKVWPSLRDHWAKHVSWLDGSRSHFPETLERVALIGVAPEQYWSSCLGLWPKSKAGRFPSEAWPPFWKLVDALGQWFDIHFVAVEGSLDDVGSLSARIRDLRSESGQ